MLRILVVALVLANLLYAAWNAGLLAGVGFAPARERDPTRVLQQVRPDAVRVVPASSAGATPGPASVTAPQPAASAATAPALSPSPALALSCLESGPFAGAALEAAERALAGAALPEGSWVRTSQDVPALYAVVLGPFDSREAQQKKREEIARLRLPMEALDLLVNSGATRPALALGRYDSRSAAEAALAGFSQRGVRTARVSLLRAPGSESRLRIESATPDQVERLRALGVGALAGGFSPCAVPASTAASAPTL